MMGDWFQEQVDAHLDTMDEGWEADLAEEDARRRAEQQRLNLLRDRLLVQNLLYQYHRPESTAVRQSYT